jgi:hypothetical protein
MHHAFRINDARARLVRALHTTSTLAALREEIVHVMCLLDPTQPDAPSTVDQAAVTERVLYGPDFEPDSAPPVPITRPSGGP